MDLDENRINQSALALLYLTLHDQCRAWKGMDWDILGRLHELGFIENPVGKAKSVVFTEKGLKHAQGAVEQLFGSSQNGSETKRVKYGSREAIASSAAGVTGVLCSSLAESGGHFLRVNDPSGAFVDYQLRHDDLEVTISPNALASFYVIGEGKLLDHSPEVLGLEPVEE